MFGPCKNQLFQIIWRFVIFSDRRTAFSIILKYSLLDSSYELSVFLMPIYLGISSDATTHILSRATESYIGRRGRFTTCFLRQSLCDLSFCTKRGWTTEGCVAECCWFYKLRYTITIIPCLNVVLFFKIFGDVAEKFKKKKKPECCYLAIGISRKDRLVLV